jgi:hypothetical protein
LQLVIPPAAKFALPCAFFMLKTLVVQKSIVNYDQNVRDEEQSDWPAICNE